MHGSVMEWAASQVAEHDLDSRSVLDVGSLDVNGSLRELFCGPYLGVDMRPGPGVDRVLNAHELAELGRRFDVVVCTEMLEHDDAPWLSVEAMRQMVWPGDVLLLTARGFDERGCFPVHGYPQDHWRFSITGLSCLLARCGWRPLRVIPDPEEPGVFALARAS